MKKQLEMVLRVLIKRFGKRGSNINCTDFVNNAIKWLKSDSLLTKANAKR